MPTGQLTTERVREALSFPTHDRCVRADRSKMGGDRLARVAFMRTGW